MLSPNINALSSASFADTALREAIARSYFIKLAINPKDKLELVAGAKLASYLSVNVATRTYSAAKCTSVVLNSPL